MNSGSKLLVINQYYAPDFASTGQLAAELCGGLAKRGIDVHVVTGQPSYTKNSPEAPAEAILDGVCIHRVSLGGVKGRERMRDRVNGYLRFLWGAWREARRISESAGIKRVLTFHNPPFVGLLGSWLARKKDTKFFYVLYDIHPDVLVKTGWHLPYPILKAWDLANRAIFCKAHTLVVLGQAMKNTVMAKGVPEEKIRILPPWGRPELEPRSKDAAIRLELGIADDNLLLLYAGNMGVMHPLDDLLNAAAAVKDLPVQFLFLGDGVKRAKLVERLENENIQNVTFLPYQPEDRFVRLLSAADACLVVLEPGLEKLSMPSRAFTFLSAGKALITMMASDAELVNIISEGQSGWNVKNGLELSELIRRLSDSRDEIEERSRKAGKLYRERFSKEHLINAYANMLR